jgi:hypothetical protein
VFDPLPLPDAIQDGALFVCAIRWRARTVTGRPMTSIAA